MKLYSAFNAHNIKMSANKHNNELVTNKLFEAYQLKLFDDIYNSNLNRSCLLTKIILPVNNIGLNQLDIDNLYDLRIMSNFDKLSEEEIINVNKDFINYLKQLGWKFTNTYIEDGNLVVQVDWSEY